MHPKNLLLRSICWGVAFLAFLLLPSFSRTENVSDRIKRFVQGEADTLFSLKAERRNYVFFNSGYTLTVQEKDSIRKGINPIFSLFDTEGKMVWDTVFAYWIDCELTSDKISSPKVVLRYPLYEDWGATEIFNTDGTRLAKVEETSVLCASPGGVYFYSIPSGMETNFLNVYDSLGNLLWKKRAASDFWIAVPISDSQMVFYDSKGLFIFDAQNGDTLTNLSEAIKTRLGAYGWLTASKNGEYFVLYGQSTYLSFDRNGNVLLNSKVKETVGRLEEAALSPDETILATVQVRDGRPIHYRLNFIRNLEGEKPFANFNLESETTGGYGSSPWKSITVFDDMATFLLPSGLDCFHDQGITLNTTTKCFFFDSTKTRIVDSLTVSGYLTLNTLKGVGSKFFRAVYDDKNGRIVLLRSK